VVYMLPEAMRPKTQPEGKPGAGQSEVKNP
jgi:hypothetical protein